jgi:predicted Ser/Thr protein kinase
MKNSNIQRKKNPSINEIIKKHAHLLKNPVFLDLLRVTELKYLNKGAVRKVFYFQTLTKLRIGTNDIPPGEYVVKINFIYNMTNYKQEKFKFWRIEECMQIHINFSKLGLIPKVYYIDPDFMIMKYIPGTTLEKLIHEHEDTQGTSISKQKIEELIQKRNRLEDVLEKFWKFYDVSDANFIVTPDLKKIYYIDPC